MSLGKHNRKKAHNVTRHLLYRGCRLHRSRSITIHVSKITKNTKLILAPQGSHILATLTSQAAEGASIQAVSRKSLTVNSPVLKSVVEPDSSKWPELVKSLTPNAHVFISALGTTRGQAGSFEAQRKIDYDLNLSLAQAAKESGAQVYVLISSGGVSRKSLFPYGRMKAELEDAVKELQFEHTVILKPGLLLGKRVDSRPPEAFFRGIAGGMGALSNHLVDFWTQDADVVGKAAVAAARQCASGERKEREWIVQQKEIVRLGRTEWKDSTAS